MMFVLPASKMLPEPNESRLGAILLSVARRFNLWGKSLRPFILLGMANFFTSCIHEVALPIRAAEQQLVVEGLITTDKPPYTVRLTYVTTFNNGLYRQEPQAVSGARVYISDQKNDSVLLKAVLSEPGIYRTIDTTYVGQTGNLYTLTVITPGGKTYRSTAELLKPVPAISQLNAIFERVADGSKPSGYRVLLDTQDPVEEENYYRWTAYGFSRRESTGLRMLTGWICCANCYIPVYENRVNIFTDQRVNGNSIRNRLVFFAPYYSPGQLFVEVTQQSLSREAYQFWQRFEEQQTRTGSIFDPLPATIAGNITNTTDETDQALGYFSASAISRKRLTIGADTLQLIPAYYKEFKKEGDCRFAYPYASYEPPGGVW